MKRRIIYLFSLSMAVLIVLSCSREVVGYVEVRNHLDNEISNVSWGDSVFLGNIMPGEEEGEETTSFGSNYITLEYKGNTYRSLDQIEVDAHTSATLIIDDPADLVIENEQP